MTTRSVACSFRIIQAWLLGLIFSNDQLTFPTVGDFVAVKVGQLQNRLQWMEAHNYFMLVGITSPAQRNPTALLTASAGYPWRLDVRTTQAPLCQEPPRITRRLSDVELVGPCGSFQGLSKEACL